MLFVLADALLAVKDRPRALEFDGERRHQRQWHGQKQTQKRDDHIDNSLRRENNAVSSKALRQRNPLGRQIGNSDFAYQPFIKRMAMLNRHAHRSHIH